MTPVLIVHYRNPEGLSKCLDSIDMQTAPVTSHVHDNSENNIGLTKAINQLLLRVMFDAKYAVWLSHDAVLMPDAVENALRFMDAHPRCAVAGFKQLDPDNQDRITHGGCKEAYPAGVHIVGSVANGDCATSAKMPWVNMAGCIFRLDAIREIGLLDERYFLYYQDSAWSYSAWASGWEVWYCAEAVMLHKSGCSGNPTQEQMLILQVDQSNFEQWMEGANLVERLLSV